MADTAANLARIKSAYAVWAETRGNCSDTLADLFADRVRLASMVDANPGLAFAPPERRPQLIADLPRSTREEAVAYFSGILAEWEMVHHSPDNILADGDSVAMFGRCGWRNKKTGRIVDCRIANFWRFEDGKVVEFIDIFDSARVVAAATP